MAVLNAPKGFDLGALPTGAVDHAALTKLPTQFDVILAFVKQRTDLVDRVATCRPRMTEAGGLWIAWPKKSSAKKLGWSTDVTEDTVREVALPTGLVDNKVCAVDETWSGLRLVIRLEHRKPAPSPAKTRRRASPR